MDNKNVAADGDHAKADKVRRLQSGWRRYLEIVERVRRTRQGEDTIRLDHPEAA